MAGGFNEESCKDRRDILSLEALIKRGWAVSVPSQASQDGILPRALLSVPSQPSQDGILPRAPPVLLRLNYPLTSTPGFPPLFWNFSNQAFSNKNVLMSKKKYCSVTGGLFGASERGMEQ